MSDHAGDMPGDDVITEPDLVMDRRLALQAAPTTVWPWLEQLGKGRGGWYLPRSVELFVPPSRRALRTIAPDLLGLDVGDVIPDWGPGDPTNEVIALAEPSHIVYWSERSRGSGHGGEHDPIRLTWALALAPDGLGRTDLRLRLRLDLGHPAGPLPRYGGGFVDWLAVHLLGRGLNERLRQTGAR